MKRQTIPTAVAVLLSAAAALSAQVPATGDVKEWVDGKVDQCAPKPEERRFDATGWSTDIRTALKLAKPHDRPVFLFTHDGRMGVGRC